MKRVVAEKYRDIDVSQGKRGAVIKPEPGKTKISIRLDNTVIDFFRTAVDRAGGGSYQTLINDALLEHIHRRSTLDAVRQVMREELAPCGDVGRRPRKYSLKTLLRRVTRRTLHGEVPTGRAVGREVW